MDAGEVNNRRLYEVLGVERTATDEEIRKAYKRLCGKLQYYPEKGENPNKERLQEIIAAYDILKDKHKREAYDMHGEIVFDNLREQQFDPWTQNSFQNDNAFQQIFGAQQQSKGHREPMKQVSQVPVSVDLELIYSGGQLKVDDQGITVAVEPGCPDLFEYWFSYKNDLICQTQDSKEADVAYILHIKKHRLFERSGADLHMHKRLTLKQALLGFSFSVKFLDGKDLLISSVPGEVIEFGAAKSVKGKGLPFYKDKMSHGNLIIKFSVKFPKASELTEDVRAALEKVRLALT